MTDGADGADGDLDHVGRRITGLLDALAALDGDGARLAEEAVRGIVGLYGRGLAHLAEIAGRNAWGGDAMKAFAGDDLLAGLLALHDLHPVPLPTRIARAAAAVQERTRARGVRIAVVMAEPRLVRLEVTAAGREAGRGDPVATVGDALRTAVAAAAPDVERVEVVGAGPTAPTARPATVHVPVESITLRRKAVP